MGRDSVEPSAPVDPLEVCWTTGLRSANFNESTKPPSATFQLTCSLLVEVPHNLFYALLTCTACRENGTRLSCCPRNDFAGQRSVSSLQIAFIGSYARECVATR